jgi:hypothetical protein
VISHTTKQFRKRLRELPLEVQQQARQAYLTWLRNPWHPGLRFKQIHQLDPIYSARVALGWRAVGVRSGDTVIWFWIGSHAEYDRLIANL